MQASSTTVPESEIVVEEVRTETSELPQATTEEFAAEVVEPETTEATEEPSEE